MHGHHEFREGGLLFSTDRTRLDVERIHAFLSGESYRVRGIHRERGERSLANSICFGVYGDGRQLGFARVVTDHVGFACLAGVLVVPAARGQGSARSWSPSCRRIPTCSGVCRFLLATRDAHGLCAHYGFAPLAAVERFMERNDPEALPR